jgi:hypothetical protein
MLFAQRCFLTFGIDECWRNPVTPVAAFSFELIDMKGDFFQSLDVGYCLVDTNLVVTFEDFAQVERRLFVVF